MTDERLGVVVPLVIQVRILSREYGTIQGTKRWPEQGYVQTVSIGFCVRSPHIRVTSTPSDAG